MFITVCRHLAFYYNDHILKMHNYVIKWNDFAE